MKSYILTTVPSSYPERCTPGMGGFPTSRSPIISLNDALLLITGLGVPLSISLLNDLGEVFLGLEIWFDLLCSGFLGDVLLHAGG